MSKLVVFTTRTCSALSWQVMLMVVNILGLWVQTWWRHKMETFFALLSLCAGNSPVTGESPSQRPVARRIDVFFDLCLNKRLSRDAGDLRRHSAHYDVIVMNLLVTHICLTFRVFNFIKKHTHTYINVTGSCVCGWRHTPSYGVTVLLQVHDTYKI